MEYKIDIDKIKLRLKIRNMSQKEKNFEIKKMKDYIEFCKKHIENYVEDSMTDYLKKEIAKTVDKLKLFGVEYYNIYQ